MRSPAPEVLDFDNLRPAAPAGTTMSTQTNSITAELSGGKRVDHEQDAKNHWSKFLTDAREIVAGARSRYGIQGLDVRAEGDAGGAGGGDSGGQGDGGGDDGAGGIDLSHPDVQKAIQAAEARGKAAATESIKALEAKRDELMDELKPLKKLAGSAGDLEQRLQKLEELENAQHAQDAGGDPEKFKSAVEQRAQAKAQEIVSQYKEVDAQKDQKIAELTASLEEAQRVSHRRFVESSIVRAAMPEDTKIVQDGAWDYLVSKLEEIVVPHDVEGLGTVARLKRNDALVPSINGKTPDGLMDLREVLTLSRQGKGPVPEVGFCFISNGAGSGTASPSGGGSGGPGNFHGLTQEQRMKALREHFGGDTEKYKAWMEDSPKPDQKAAGAAA